METRLRLRGDKKKWKQIKQIVETVGQDAALALLGESEALPEDVDVSRLALRSVWQSGNKWLRSYRAQPYLNEETTQEIVEALFDSCKARPLPSIPYEKVSGGLAVVNVYDCHLDKIAHTGRSDPATAFSRNRYRKNNGLRGLPGR